MKQTRTQFRLGVALTSLLLGSGVAMAIPDYPVDSFDTGTQGSMVPGGNIWWGSSTMSWDGTQDHTGNAGGSGYITCTFSSASDTSCMADITLGLGGNNPWWCPITVDLTAYSSIDFDIKWDNALSTMTVTNFNDPVSWDAGVTGSYAGMEYGTFDASPTRNTVAVQLLPDAAATGWAHVSVPVNPATPGINDTRGVYFHKWIAGTPAGTGVSAFWIDDLFFHGITVIPPPPSLSYKKAVQGANFFAATTGQYDREMIEVQPSFGVYSWLGSSPSSPTTYSFTVSEFTAPVAGQQAHLFLIPSADTGTSPDWNAANTIFVTLNNLSETNGDTYYLFQFAYKTNQPSGNSMFFSSNLNWNHCLTNASAIGTWYVKFTGDTTVELGGPGGLVTNFTAFDTDSANLFVDPINVFFGMQPNQVANAGPGQVVFSSVSVAGTAVTAFSDNFSAGGYPVGPIGGYGGLNTNLWANRCASSAAVQCVPANAYWLNWTLPDNNFKLVTNADITISANWETNGVPRKFQIGTTNYVLMTTNANFDIYQVAGTVLDSTGTNSVATNYWNHYPLAFPAKGNTFIGLRKIE